MGLESIQVILVEKKRLNFVIDACKSNNSIIRIGVNSGSLEKDLLKKVPGPRP